MIRTNSKNMSTPTGKTSTWKVWSLSLKCFPQRNLKIISVTSRKKGRSDYKMCKTITELIQDGKDEGKNEGRLEGIPEGEIEAVKNMIKELGVSLSKALSVVKLSPDDWNKYNNTI
ncbi:MAG: hypothetical protein IJL20_05420 [Lachnospiraceae bacterium]|nr:hypothetical protein [Lachnospiraceae bacterium]